MTKAVFPGSFDPFTMGHLDLLRRGCALFDEVCVGVLQNVAKKAPLFSVDERCAQIRAVAVEAGLVNVSVSAFSGLTVEFARDLGAACILRGIRDGNDLSYEVQMEAMNRYLAPEIQTVYMAASPQYAHLSSSAVKEVCAFGGKIEGLVPAPIQISIAERLNKR